MSLDTDYRIGDRVCTWAEIRAHLIATHPACPECGVPADEIDHIWPRYFGGEDWSDNLRSICGRCNRAKGYRVDVESAETGQLRHAVAACLDRALAAAAEAEPFLDELSTRPAARLHLLAAREHLAVLYAQMDYRIALADQALARLEAA